MTRKQTAGASAARNTRHGALRALMLLSIASCGAYAQTQPAPPAAKAVALREPSAALVPAQAPLRLEGPAAGVALSRVAIDDYQKQKKSTLAITAGISSTGLGLLKLCSNQVDATTTDRPILEGEIERCRAAGVEFIELPMGYDALVVVVNPGNNFVNSLSMDELRKLWEQNAQAKITRWKHMNPAWPDMPIKLYGSDALHEGATYFNEAVLGHAQAARRDYTGSADESLLAQAVKRDAYGLSYLSLSTYLQHGAGLKAVAISERGGSPVIPSAETITQGKYRTLARPLFLYVRVQALEQPALRELTEHWLVRGAQHARQAKLIALSDTTYRNAQERLKRMAKGSVWEGKIAVGVSLQEIERRQAL